jgi:hypothetical protein
MISGCVGLLPLLFTPQGRHYRVALTVENLIKVTYTALFFILLYPHLGKPNLFERLYYVGLCSLIAVEELAPLVVYSGMDRGILGKYEFLPLMGVSVGCAIGIVWGWLRFLRTMISE